MMTTHNTLIFYSNIQVVLFEGKKLLFLTMKMKTLSRSSHVSKFIVLLQE